MQNKRKTDFLVDMLVRVQGHYGEEAIRKIECFLISLPGVVELDHPVNGRSCWHIDGLTKVVLRKKKGSRDVAVPFNV